MDYRNVENQGIINKRITIEGDLPDFDRVFYQRDDKNNADLLLFASIQKQLIGTLNLMNRQWSILNLGAEKRYQDIEVYDRKIFCVDIETLMIDILFLTRKQQAYHKRRITFANKGIRLKEEAQLVIWKHDEAGVMYRCLLGPLEDGRYMNFDLLERYFSGKADTDVVIGNVFFINLGYSGGNGSLDDVICTIDELRKSIICYHKRAHVFFENNDFAGEVSRILKTMETIDTRTLHVKRIYSYCPYDFFPQSRKNQLQASAKNIGQKTDLEAFVRKLYREVLICMREGYLLKLTVLQEAAMADDNLWKFTKIDMDGTIVSDIAVNDRTGIIYCLCKREIRIFEWQEKNSEVMLKAEMNKKQIISNNFLS